MRYCIIIYMYKRNNEIIGVLLDLSKDIVIVKIRQ